MKLQILFGFLIALCLFALPNFVFGQGGSGIGSLPATTSSADEQVTVKPGDQPVTNEDGVTVTNNGTSNGNATMTPKKGTKDSKTTVDTKSGFEGAIDGLDDNDVVSLGSSNGATISGKGGTVNMKGNSTATVTNNASGPNAKSIKVNTPSGGSISVLPGMTVPITTP